MVLASPVFTPVSWSSKPGINMPEPSTSGCVLGLAAFEFLAVNAADEVDDQLVAFGCLLGSWQHPCSSCCGSASLPIASHRPSSSETGTVRRSILRSSVLGRFDSREALRVSTVRVGVLAFLDNLRPARPSAASPGLQLAYRLHQSCRPIRESCRSRTWACICSPCILRIRFAGDLAGAGSRACFTCGRDLLHLAIDALPRFRLAGMVMLIGPLEAFGIGGFFDLHGCTNSYGFLNCLSCRVRVCDGVRNWCGRRDSNPHIFRYWYLKPARLPVPPRPLTRTKPRVGVAATRIERVPLTAPR